MIQKRVMAGSCLMALLVDLDAVASAREVTECILVSKVGFAEDPGALPTEIERNQWWVTSGHQLTPGSLNVLLIRRFSEDPGSADSQRFTKITAVIKDAGLLTAGGDSTGERQIL